jgi:hypothetical protein
MHNCLMRKTLETHDIIHYPILPYIILLIRIPFYNHYHYYFPLFHFLIIYLIFFNLFMMFTHPLKILFLHHHHSMLLPLTSLYNFFYDPTYSL